MSQLLILVAALCMDTFLAGIAYGTNHVQVDPGKGILLNLICSGCLGAALLFGNMLELWLPGELAANVGFYGLLLLGLLRLLHWGFRKGISRFCVREQTFGFTLSGLRILICICADPMAADMDGSLSLGWRETCVLALAMSFDSLTVGTMAAFLPLNLWGVTAGSFGLGMLLLYAGLAAGKRLSSYLKWDLSWLCGVLLVLLAVMSRRG